MSTSIIRKILINGIFGLTTLAMSGCGGGNSGTDTSSSATRANLESANISSNGFPWFNRLPGISKRWALPIPVKTNGEVRANAAMDAIEAQLGMTVFDRTAINNTDVATITRGLIVSQGTSFLPAGANPASFCANVSSAPRASAYPGNFVLTTGEISTRLYINLDNPSCTASLDITIHEFGHALGLGPHFDGFGTGDAISPAFWSALSALYRQPAGTAAADMRYE